ncbi:hypothetical protein DAI22_03g377966 [Oryza sativa Japonica Group]|nr:hypothetical protein DAI22_03g377966 [Oryza sativa Japonica Group]
MARSIGDSAATPARSIGDSATTRGAVATGNPATTAWWFIGRSSSSFEPGVQEPYQSWQRFPGFRP